MKAHIWNIIKALRHHPKHSQSVMLACWVTIMLKIPLIWRLAVPNKAANVNAETKQQTWFTWLSTHLIHVTLHRLTHHECSAQKFEDSTPPTPSQYNNPGKGYRGITAQSSRNRNGSENIKHEKEENSLNAPRNDNGEGWSGRQTHKE